MGNFDDPRDRPTLHDAYGVYMHRRSRELAVYEWDETLAWPVFRLYHAPYTRMDKTDDWALVVPEGHPMPEVFRPPSEWPKSVAHELRNEKDRERRAKKKA